MEDNNSGLFAELTECDSVLVSFGGIRQGIGIPVFEFFNILKRFDCDKVFVKDFSQMWYQRGIDNNIDDLKKLVKKLNDILLSYKKVIFIGNSMGGYAAILFGILLNVENVISFAPQTFIDSKNRFWYRDRRWSSQISRVHKAKLFPEYYDLRTVLKKNSKSITNINVYYSERNRLDRIHAVRIGVDERVNLHGRHIGGHEVVKELKRTGELLSILEDLFVV